MDSAVRDYLQNIAKEYASGQAREHSYRPALKDLVQTIDQTVLAINEPKRQEVGAPDFIINRKDIPIAFIEAKDVDVGLNEVEKSDQIKRYQGLGNLMVTNYLEFRFYEFETKIAQITLGKLENGKITIDEDQFQEFELLLKSFLTKTVKTITSAKGLAKIMGDKARLMREIIFKALLNPIEENSALHEQMEAFKKILLHDLTEETFADIYSQTITYGLFAARYHDMTPDNFSRQEAEYLLPKSNPFLRKFFHHIAGPELDDRIVWIVDALADVFNHCDLSGILKNFGKTTQRVDPVLHFYETFLAEYDPKLRKSRGVYYTPEPVVNFIVRAVDHVLKTYFNLQDGLKDTSTVEISYEGQGKTAKDRHQKKTVHKVQVLDPATGTGTFLNEVIKYIHQDFTGQQGIWSEYVEKHLLPRVHGFELMMAPYTIAHLKIGMYLNETGYKGGDERLGIYLTNSLSEVHPDTNTLFASWLSQEANEANHIKKDVPIMVVLGNPPYSVSSNNKEKWILNLIEDYKKGLNEKKINLDDDYIKFIRYAQYFIEKNQTGVVAMITNNSFLDGITHRQMRKTLLEAFDVIYIYDLHGNAKKKETAPDGGKDENVFDIMQGVSISIFIKTPTKQKNKIIYHVDSYGKRELKYERLWEETLRTADYKPLEPKAPYYFFVPKNFDGEEKYRKGVKINELFKDNSCGIETQKDSLVVKFTKQELNDVRTDFKLNDDNLMYEKYKIRDTRDWTLKNARLDILRAVDCQIQYRPFDARWSFYSGTTKGIIAYPRREVMKHFSHENIALLSTNRITSFENWHHAFISNQMTERCTVSLQTGEVGYVFPLYLYPETNESQQSSFSETPLQRIPNLNQTIVEEISQKLTLHFTPERSEDTNTFCPEDILNYIYAVLHSPTYRKTYKEFLKIDFPRVPFTNKSRLFFDLVAKGKALSELHLLTAPTLNHFITQYPISGSNTVGKISYETAGESGKVYINKDQYFDSVPKVAWEFFIGGYQPAQKWLKDRAGRQLNFDDILHYQKIIIALIETDKLMKEIDVLVIPMLTKKS